MNKTKITNGNLLQQKYERNHDGETKNKNYPENNKNENKKGKTVEINLNK